VLTSTGPGITVRPYLNMIRGWLSVEREWVGRMDKGNGVVVMAMWVAPILPTVREWMLDEGMEGGNGGVRNVGATSYEDAGMMKAS